MQSWQFKLGQKYGNCVWRHHYLYLRLWKQGAICILIENATPMKNLLFWPALAIALASSWNAAAQFDRAVESKITNVTVFLAKAQITREGSIRLEPGKSTLVFTGLAAQLDPQSIQVAGKGSFTILGTVHRANFLNELERPKSLKLLMDSVLFLKKQVGWENTQKEILNKEEQMLLSNQQIGGKNTNLTVVELKAMSEFYRNRLSDIAGARMKSDDKLFAYQQRIAKLEQQINTQNELFHRNTSEVVVTVEAAAATQASLTLDYVVANAGWLPHYDLRAINTQNPIQLSYKANVFQGTGEDWKNVHLKLSTANPNLNGQKPELTAWYLNIIEMQMERKAYAMSRGSRKEAGGAPAMMAKEVEEVQMDASSVADMVETIQTSLNTEFDIALPYTVPSSGQATAVDIRNYTMNATYQYAVAPKLETDAFLMARATGWEEFSLLPGEANIFFEGTFVGKSYIDPNELKDTLNVSLGRDKRIVVKRDKVKEFTSRKAIGGNERETFGYEISVRNSKSEPIQILIEDQIPVSQHSLIEVTTIDLGGAVYTKETGKLAWRWTLQPGESRKVQFRFEVKHPKDKPISGL
jgi:uncharacterized protein (TIGR02231 family)